MVDIDVWQLMEPSYVTSGGVRTCRLENPHPARLVGVSSRGSDDGGVQVVLMADTHVPKRAKDLPTELWMAVDAADLVIHAGDWVEVDLLDRLQCRSRRLLACWGNNDGPALRRRLPEVARAEIEGLSVGVVHETGPAAGRELRCAGLYPDFDLLCFGHSHIPWDSTTATGLRLLNPGSPTDRRRQPYRSYITFELVDGAILNVHLRQLPQP